jgi:ribonuclease BN (tRNA processing enzyme)
MRVTIIGCGDAFGSGGRFNTCFMVETGQATLLVDCGASTPVALNARGIDHCKIDGIILSHLHGDHFGGLPFLLLDAQFFNRRDRPLLIAGPPGTQARLAALLEVSFPGATANAWRFSWNVMEIEVGRPTDVLGHAVTTTEVMHYSGAPSTAVRLSDGQKLFAYSGDTEWAEPLVSVADGADLMIIECYAYAGRISGHISWDILKPRIADLKARRIMVTHMNPSMLARLDEVKATGIEIAEDGKVIDL